MMMMMMVAMLLLHNPMLARYLFVSLSISRFCTRTILIHVWCVNSHCFKRHFQCIVVCEHLHKRESERKIQNGTSLFRSRNMYTLVCDTYTCISMNI